MTRPLRLALFFIAIAGLIAALPAVEHAMPVFGAHPLPYGELINRLGPPERHVLNMVTAVNFDFRGFDTLGEETMLLVAVTGTAVLLRGQRGETTTLPATVPGRAIPRRSEAMTLIGRLFAPVTLVFGIFVVLHAQLTPGGGFQGGVIIASGLLLVYLAEGYGPWRRLMNPHAFDALEGGGAALYAVAGLAPMAWGARYLQNIVPLGKMGSLLSGGLMLVLNIGVACAVTGGFGVLLMEFLKETRAEDPDEEEEPSE